MPPGDSPDQPDSSVSPRPDGLLEGGSGPGPRFWLPLASVVALLVAAGLAGRYIVPGPGPGPGAEPRVAGVTASVTTDPPGPSPAPSRPILPTLPPRPADTLAQWATEVGGAVGVPRVALQAYGYAQLLMARSDPACHLTWTTLAAVGDVESSHGQANGAVLTQGGRSDPLIAGPLLDGQGGRAKVPDTDAGAFDGDSVYDRTMGPLHLSPPQWRVHAADADADGVRDPYDIDDASLSLARLLCSGPEDLSQLDGWNSALARYHGGDSYASHVFQIADGYAENTRSL